MARQCALRLRALQCGPLRVGLMCAGLMLGTTAATAASAVERTAVVLVFDGVSPRSFEAAPVPTFERMRREGSFTHAFVPPFPSNSLVGGFTLSTGCLPERHGIVNNLFEDPVRGLYDHSQDADWLLECEGLHETAERQGIPSAAMNWYGSHSSTRGPLASVVGADNYEDRPADPARAEQVVELLGRSGPERPRLILAYFRGPDGVEHYSGFDSEETAAAVAGMDANVARIVGAIEAQPAGRETALFVTTDHGMLDLQILVNIERILRWHDIAARPLSSGASSYLYFDDPNDAEAIEAARVALSSYEELEAWRPSQAPAWAKIGTSARVGQLVVTTAPPYFIEDSDIWPGWLRWMGKVGPRFANATLFAKATHGYPPSLYPEVNGVLYAWGNGIARGIEFGSAHASDLKPTVLRWLGVGAGSPVDGRTIEALFPR